VWVWVCLLFWFVGKKIKNKRNAKKNNNLIGRQLLQL